MTKGTSDKGMVVDTIRFSVAFTPWLKQQQPIMTQNRSLKMLKSNVQGRLWELMNQSISIFLIWHIQISPIFFFLHVCCIKLVKTIENVNAHKQQVLKHYTHTHTHAHMHARTQTHRHTDHTPHSMPVCDQCWSLKSSFKRCQSRT